MLPKKGGSRHCDSGTMAGAVPAHGQLVGLHRESLSIYSSVYVAVHKPLQLYLRTA